MNLIQIRQKHWILALTMKQIKNFCLSLAFNLIEDIKEEAIGCDLLPMSIRQKHQILASTMKQSKNFCLSITFNLIEDTKEGAIEFISNVLLCYAQSFGLRV